MAPLSTELRNKLERTITEARDVAEAGACAALEGMAVNHFEPYKHQSIEQRKLRNHLRARARQLGDIQNAKGQLQIDHLAHECAYEHWHRMLFARFLAENNLLIEPSHGVAISLQECEELAQAAGTDLWTYASRCAQQMLPQIFRPDDPLLQVTLAREHQVKLERLLASLDPQTFKADDSLGWVYQFWQSKKKKEVNDSGQKITGDTLPAVTQLFTEHYMVLFLLHNTIGAWHAGKVLAANPKLAQSATNEEELRKAMALTALGGYSFDYLRFVRDDENLPWRPAAGTFEGWPKAAAQLKVLDPCCGSGHFLVAVFDLLTRLRMQEENLSVSDAIDAVLKDNVFGLEIDARCTQIAAFNLALATWKLTGFRQLPGVHIACCGIGPQSTEEQWLKLVEDSGIPMPALGKEAIKNGLLNLHRLFSQAPTLGSLIDPTQLPSDLIAADYETIKPYLDAAMIAETGDDEIHERAIAAAGMVKAADLLAQDYTLITTNVPYLGMRKQGEILRDFCSRFYSNAKEDLATVFCARFEKWLEDGMTMGIVTPQNWFYQYRYRHHRKNILNDQSIQLIARLGEGGFQSPDAAGAFAALSIIDCRKPSDDQLIWAIDASDKGRPDLKALELESGQLKNLPQKSQLKNPDSRLSFEQPSNHRLLNELVITAQGIKTGDDSFWVRYMWEIFPLSRNWQYYQTSAEKSEAFTGRNLIIDWSTDGDGMVRPRTGSRVIGKNGVVVSSMREIAATFYNGDLHFSGATPLVPINQEHLPAIWAFCSSSHYNRAVREIEQNIAVTTDTLAKVPFELDYWQKIAAKQYPKGLPEPESDDPTQWLFHGRPEASTHPLQVAVARMLGYRWPAELDPEMRLSIRARELVKKCKELLKFADDDGIVCIPAVRGEEPASERLLAILAACGIKTDIDLDDWLRNSFFEEHCKLFHHRPFIWHIWDGRRRDGFHALVNYHKLAEGNGKGKKLLESLTYSYLGEWISRQQDGVRRGEGGAEDRLAAATELQKQLIAIIEGQPPYDVFVRWKPLHKQPICWEPDINDGVRMNIRPFMTASLSNGRTGAGILRWKPNIKWEKDRGTEPQRPKNEYPWFWGWDGNTVDFTGGPEFKGERFNAYHYTIQAKQHAREAVEKERS